MSNVSELKEAAGWSPELIQDLELNLKNGRVGTKLLSETERVRVWHLEIQPGERFGFHCHVLDYFWTALSHGSARSHYDDGRVVEVFYLPGDTKHLQFAAGEISRHDLENIGQTPLQFVTVEFKDSANPALQI